jgi:enterochelin esterase-like enzyme
MSALKSLQAKGYSVHYAEYYGGHNPMNWQGTLANAIRALLVK